MGRSQAIVDEVRHALRAIARAKTITSIVVLSLALGTGANAAVYGVLHALLLRGPAGVGDPSRLIDIFTSELSGDPYGQSSYPDFASITEEAAPILGVAAIDDNAIENVRIGELGQSARIASVSDGFFSLLQMQPHRGRLLAAGDASADPPGAVLSVELAEQLGGADEVVGKTVTIGERPHAVVGVAPALFRGLRAGRETEVWVSIVSPGRARGDRRLSLIGRLGARVDLERASSELRRVSVDLASRHPTTNRGSVLDADAPRLMTARAHSQMDPGASRQVYLVGAIVGGASAILLVSACFTVGNLLLSWAVARRQEIAVKMALGASRGRLVRQLLVEAQCLSLAGGALGLLFAAWTSQAIPSLFMVEQAALLDTRLDVRVLLVALGVAIVSGALFGVAPALQGTGSPAVTALRGDAGGVSDHQGGGRLRAMLVGGQVAFSTLLLVGTGLLISGLAHALEGDLASTVRRVAVASMELPGRFADPVRGIRARSRLLAGVAETPGVAAAGWAGSLPLGRGNRLPFRIEQKGSEVADTLDFDTNAVSPGYFDALSLRCVEGRLFDGTDHALAEPVAIVDELLARRYLGATAAGRYLVDGQGTPRRIVGVVRTGTYRTLQQGRHPTVYVPAAQDYLYRGFLIVRTFGEPSSALDAIRRVVAATGDGAAVLRMSTLEQHVSESLALDRLTTTLVAVCGLIALVMSTLGVYGTMADAVERRTKEIGLRAALGAGRFRIARLIVLDAFHPAVGGLLTGGAAALLLMRVARTFSAAVPSIDAMTLAGVAGALSAALAFAAVVPLRRALRVSPNIALRAQ